MHDTVDIGRSVKLGPGAAALIGMTGIPRRPEAGRGKLRVYHFVGRDHGLEDIRRRRLKITILADINDPFELLPSVADGRLHSLFLSWRLHFDEWFGMLCFSRHWRNPVLWSHYAGKHAGLCLGFDIPAKGLIPVRYAKKRVHIRSDLFSDAGPRAGRKLLALLSTKYEHWRYEGEMRLFVPLDYRHDDGRLIFANFSENMQLKEVIVGSRSTITRRELRAALGRLAPSVKVFKARLAFNTYTVIRLSNDPVWK